ncbi:hypothetical protein ABLM29_19165, partial [Nocardioides sp. YIM 152588]
GGDGGAGGAGGDPGLVALVADRARYSDAGELVAGLTRRGLVAGGALTPAGRDLVSGLQQRIAVLTAPLWSDLPADDVAATERILGTVQERARAVLAAVSG